MTSPASFKTMIKDGTIKRADAMKVRYDDIHVEPGFNLRDHDDEFEQGIVDLTAYILDGGYVPPLEVRPSPEGDGVIIVDGHRRHIAIGRAIEQGAPIEYVSVVAFAGNDVDRVARIMTSQEGAKLRPLEVAAGYKRLGAFGLSPDEIARKVNKTRQHVEQLLILAHANSDVHALVKSGAVSASVAIDAVRKHGEEAGAFLAGKQGEAQAAGKARVTAQTVKGKPLPRALAEKLESALSEAVECIPASTVAQLEELRTKHDGRVPENLQAAIPVWVLLNLMDDHAAVVAERRKQEQRAREKAAKAAQTAIEGA